MTISFSGLASGLDTSTWINALTSLKKAKVTTIQEKQETIASARDTLNSVKSFFNSFRTTLEKITDANFGISTMDLFVQNLAVSSDASKLTATVDTTAEENTYLLKIDKLATNTEAKSIFLNNYTDNSTATENSKLSSLSLETGSVNSGTIYVNVNGVSRGVEVNADETIGSFITKLKNIGVDASFDNANGKINMNVSLSDIDDGDTNIKKAFHLSGVNEGYYSDKLQYSKIETNTATATYSTKLSELGYGISFDNKDENGYESINVTNSSGEATEIKVNEDTTLGNLIDELTHAGFYASLSDSGVFELSGGVITGGTFNISTLFGLSEDTSGAMVICNELTTVISNPDKVDLQTRLVEDLGITRGYYKVTTSDGSNFYKKVYSGMTTADFMSELDNLGISASIDTAEGKITISGGSLSALSDEEVTALYDNGTIQENDVNMRKATNFLNCIGYENGATELNFSNSYSYNDIDPPSVVIGPIIANTKFSDIITNGEAYKSGYITVQKDGFQYNVDLGENDTFESLMNTLSIHGFDSLINDKGQLIIQTTGNSKIQAYSNPETASNLLDIIGANSSDWILSNLYTSNALNVITTEENFSNATEDTLISDISRIISTDSDNVVTSVALTNESLISSLNGGLELVVDGITNTITVSSDETIGTLLNKFKTLGLEASMDDGKISLHSGYHELSINTPEEDGSSILSSGLLTYNEDNGGYISSNCSLVSTVDLGENLSASGWAEIDTKLSILNVTSGSLSVYKNGSRAFVNITHDDTFASLQDKINTELSNKYGEGFGDIEISFEHGYMYMKSASGGVVTSGASTDTSNFLSITGSYATEDGKVTSARELYKVNVSSVLTSDGLFRAGNITEGDFIIGDQTITIDSTTTLNDIISAINGENSSVTAYWDTVSGQLVLKSNLSGSMFVNVEAGSSNFTDIMGFTSTERDGNNDILSTTLNIQAQDIGENSVFSINGTMYTSSSNTVGSDISRIEGVTLNLQNMTEGEEISLKIQKDTETIANAVEDVVTSYNYLMEAVDDAISSSGELSDQTTLKMIRNQIKSYMTGSLSGSSIFRNLDAIGICAGSASATNISTSNSVVTSLTFDKDKFGSAFLENPNALKFLLVGDGVNDGIFNKIETLVENSLQGVSGYFDSQVASYNNQIKQLSEQVTKINRSVSSYQEMLESKFSAMDMLISNMQQQYSSFLTS